MTKTYIKLLIIAVLLGSASWAFYTLIDTMVSDLLSKQGVTNPYYQALTVIIIALLALFIFGISFKKSLNKLFK